MIFLCKFYVSYQVENVHISSFNLKTYLTNNANFRPRHHPYSQQKKQLMYSQIETSETITSIIGRQRSETADTL